jgi:carbonic anhydrase
MITLILLSFIALSSCNNESKSHSQDKEEKQAHWSYEGETSPEHWAEIEKNSDCSGKRQSPVNIIEDDAIVDSIEQHVLKILYRPKTVLSGARNNGHSIQFDFESGDSIKYGNEIYHLKQIHFHEPAEHTINGIRYPIEIHLVHMSNTNKFTVLSKLGREGAESQLIESLESFLPLEIGELKEIHREVDLSTIYSGEEGYFTYMGSLTTPPCTENVNWIIFKRPIILSLAEVLKLKEIMPLNNYRGEQPLNGRSVYRSSAGN